MNRKRDRYGRFTKAGGGSRPAPERDKRGRFVKSDIKLTKEIEALKKEVARLKAQAMRERKLAVKKAVEASQEKIKAKAKSKRQKQIRRFLEGEAWDSQQDILDYIDDYDLDDREVWEMYDQIYG